MNTAGIILAGGTGKRFGGSMPKQFQNLVGKPILEWSLLTFYQNVDLIVVVSHSDWLEQVRSITGRYPGTLTTTGGQTRQLSVYEGLKALQGKDCSVVAIHDGARPLFTRELLQKSLSQASKSGSAIPVLPMPSTVAQSDGTAIDSYIDRKGLYLVQTPQVFNFGLISQAHEKALSQQCTDYTDDSQLLPLIGLKPMIINGEQENIKITDPLDMKLAELLINK